MSFRAVIKRAIPKGLFPAIEPYGHLIEAVSFNLLNGLPSRGMKVIGVTGTNGKTTTCFMIYQMLQDAGYKVGLMTTVAYGIGEDIQPQMHHMTTVSTPQLLHQMKLMKQANCDYVILETTSHALAQYRVWGVPYILAIMTNITHEHLAYHRTFARYVHAKRRLFEMTNRNRAGLRAGVINADDPSAQLFAAAIQHPILYGIEKGSVRATGITLSPQGLSYHVQVGDEHYDISCQMPGSFNVYNSLAAVCAGHILGLSKQQIEQGIAALPGVEGRMTRIDEGQPFDVIVDYAHTPDSFEKLFQDMRPLVKGKIITLFGSLGGGDKGKRPLQGKIAGQYADLVIVTEEDDRQEDSTAIMNEIAKGAEDAGKVRDEDLLLIHDRPTAMKRALKEAQKGDTVLLLGKGHEKTIEHADGEYPWDEIGLAHKLLKDRLKNK